MHFLKFIWILLFFPCLALAAETLVSENFDDAQLSQRGWYDNTVASISKTEHIPGSTGSLEFNFKQGATKPVNGGPLRKKFADTNSVYVSYYIKYSANWQGSNKPYHPHEIYLLTNLDADWSGLAYTHMTMYIEQNEGRPHIGIQDGVNIDSSRIGTDLTLITEKRAVGGCNGDSDGYGDGTCYSASGTYYNGKKWKADAVYFQDSPGPYYKNDWHLVEVFLQLNSISNGKGMADGVIQYRLDGKLLSDHHDVVFRTAQHSTMKINQIIIAPYIGDGSPIDQTFWIDNLQVASARPDPNSGQAPLPPANLRVVK